MNKHLILLLIAGFFAFSSCSSDDDATEEFSVVGSWELESTNPPIPGLNPDACPTRHQITFNDGGTADWIFYDENNNCEAQNSSGNWSKTSATEYSISIPDYGTFDGTVSFSSAQRFTFSTTYEVNSSSFPVQFTFVK